MKKILTILLLLILPSLLFTGCWDATEPEAASLVTALGINLTSTNNIEVIFHDETLAPNGQQMHNRSGTFDIHKATGSTIYDAMQNISRSNPEKIYLSHTKVIIVSEELARQQGIKPVLDFLERTPEIRQNSLFLISKKGDFEKIFLPNAELNMDSGSLIEKIVSQKNTNSFLLDSKLRDFLELSWDSYCTPYAMGVGTFKSFADSQNLEQGYNDINIITYNLDVGDIAVFKDDKMVGWLTGDKSRGFLIVKGQVEGGNIYVTYEGKLITLKLSHVKSKIKPTLENGKMKVKINVEVRADIGESNADISFENKNVIDKVSQILDNQIKKEINNAVISSMKLSSDVFEFGDYFFKDYPNYWKSVSNHWDNYYSKLDVSIQVNSNIQHIGLVKE